MTSSPSRVLLNHEPKLYYAERISLREYMTRFRHVIASKDECAADDLQYNWRIDDDGAYRIGGRVFHGGDSTREKQQTFRDKSESNL